MRLKAAGPWVHFLTFLIPNYKHIPFLCTFDSCLHFQQPSSTHEVYSRTAKIEKFY